MIAPAAALLECGAHFVRVQPGSKAPLDRAWQRRRPSLDAVEHHLSQGGRLGIIPASLECTVLDVDRGDPYTLGALFDLSPPFVALASRRGVHGWYSEARSWARRTFAAGGCEGDAIAGGYVIIWPPAGLAELAAAIADPIREPAPLPADLFELHGVQVPDARRPPMPTPRLAEQPDLSTVHPGGRNLALFEYVRMWAYGQHRGTDYRAWCGAVHEYAIAANAEFPTPLPAAEAADLARKIAGWTWADRGPIDHSPAAQSRRGRKSGKVRRAAAAGRDRRIVTLRAEGHSLRAIGAAVGVDEKTVRRVLHRTEPMLARPNRH